MMPFWSKLFVHHPRKPPEIDDLQETITRLRAEQEDAARDAIRQETVEADKSINIVLRSCEEVLKSLHRIKGIRGK